MFPHHGSASRLGADAGRSFTGVCCCVSTSGRVLPPASEAATPSTSLWAAEPGPTDPSSCGSSGSFTSSAVGRRIQCASPRSDQRFSAPNNKKRTHRFSLNVFNNSMMAFIETLLLKYRECPLILHFFKRFCCVNQYLNHLGSKINEQNPLFFHLQVTLLWEDKAQHHLLASTRLYFLPEDTPKGRTQEHGEVSPLPSAQKDSTDGGERSLDRRSVNSSQNE